MSLEIRKSSKWWYGVFVVNAQKTVINLKWITEAEIPRIHVRWIEATLPRGLDC